VSLKTFANRPAAAPAKPENGSTPATSAQYPSTTLPRIAARVSKKSERRIRELALDEDCTVQELIVRGLSALFVERGLEPLEESAGDVDVSSRRAKEKRA
jgi:hypothetical protein